ncbi:MAG: isoleucine--tRNA ligase [Bacteroidetes bacterium]|nr:isoleucine--tRNA ligase [Bacteroidota bacterium]
MASKYQETKQLSLPFIEQEYLQKWEDEQTFKQSVDKREGSEAFVFYEGPPSANGMPGIHHVISRTLKDLVCRYKTMQGFQVKRKAGWDTHGLPVELGVEKELGITKEDIGKKISVEDYNQKCREAVMRYKDKWDEITRKMGYWVDLKDPYITFDNKYIETLWWALKQLHDKDLLYKSVSIQPYSPAAGTGLSSHELNQPGTYKNVKDTTVVAMFSAIRNPQSEFLYNAIQNLKEGNLFDQYHEQKGEFLLLNDAENIYFLAWTTTPWTLPSNCGLTVGADIDYVLVNTINPYAIEGQHKVINVVLAENLLSKYFSIEPDAVLHIGQESFSNTNVKACWKIISRFKGRELEGIRYKQLIPFEGNSATHAGGDPFRVILGDFVTTEDGTGIVHTAPAFGADDYKVGKKNNIGILTLVDKEGKFIETANNNELKISGRFVKNYKDDSDWKDVDIDIAVYLKQSGQAFKVEKYEHTYPHCWRTDKPIIYYPLDAWFIRTTAVKERMIALNKTIQWKPRATGEGRFGNWLENMVDWNLSRSRYWGTPLPVWVSKDGKETKCIGSIDELIAEVKKANKTLSINQLIEIIDEWDGNFSHLNKITNITNKIGLTQVDRYKRIENKLDLHKPLMDQIVLCDSRGIAMYREPDLVDVWFDSGAMPYAQLHYPFDAHPKTQLKHNFPANFIAEGVDQTRGWFYTLHALGVMLFDSVAYKTVVSNGLVLDKNGNKMSKRLGNIVDPFETIEKFGADATRWYLITNASPWDSLKFDIEGIKEVQRKYFGTLYNTYQFFALYANVDSFTFKERYIPVHQRPEIDQWILSSLNSLIKNVTESLDEYEPTQAGRALEYFLDEHLSNWYVRLCRRRFWKGEYEHDKICAYQTLYECLETISRLMAPIAPFFADWLFRNINSVSKRIDSISVHLSDYPVSDNSIILPILEERMKLAQDISSLVLSIRKKTNIKVRQPLQKILVPVLNRHMEEQISRVSDLIRNEVNVKEIQFISESEGGIQKKVKANFKLLGARLGGKMKSVAAAIAQWNQAEILQLERNGSQSLLIDGEDINLSISEVEIIAEDIPGWSVATKDGVTVALDLTITPILEEEGNAREFVNRIQKLRKDSGFELTDKIIVKVEQNDTLASAIKNFNNYISAEILANSIDMLESLDSETEIDINEAKIKVLITKN